MDGPAPEKGQQHLGPVDLPGRNQKEVPVQERDVGVTPCREIAGFGIMVAGEGTGDREPVEQLPDPRPLVGEE